MAILNFNSVEFHTTFLAVLNVFKLINITFVEQKFGSINIQNLNFKLLITIFGLYNIILIICIFVYMFFLFIKIKKMCLKTPKKIIFNNMHKMYLHYFLDFFVVRNFQKTETFYIKKLKDIK